MEPLANEFVPPEPISLPMTEAELKDWMTQYLSRLLALDPAGMDTSARFDAFGIDSIEAVVMAGIMEEEFSTQVEPALLFVSPSIDLFAAANCRKD